MKPLLPYSKMEDDVLTVDHRNCGLALEECDTRAFERFANAFHAAIVGTSFVPLGGIHDGGADGFEEPIYQSQNRANAFMQASKTATFEDKIKKTIKRLVEFGRTPTVITFYFSLPCSTADIIEEKIGDEFDVTIKIRSRNYIEAHINHSPQTAQAYRSYLEPSIYNVLSVGGIGREREFPFESRTACAFIGQELNRRRGNASILVTLTDALILWSLEGTDPEKGIFLTEDEILAKITEAIPTSRHFIKSELPKRLSILSSKSNPSGREISWHRKEGVYALRYEERMKIVSENSDEIELFSKISDEIVDEAQINLPTRLHKFTGEIVSAIRNCIEAMFRKQGLSVALYIVDGSDGDFEFVDLSEEIDAELDRMSVRHSDKADVRDFIVKTLRSIIYSPSDTAHDYMLRLSTTYFVLFALKNEPKIVEYFSKLSEKLVLYIGSDLLIKALSEYYVSKESQMITNTFKLLKESGSKLILADPALEEVFTHVHASILEFENYYAPIEGSIDENFIPAIDRILIRSYFYAKLGINTDKVKPRGWRSYIGNIGSYEDLKRKSGKDGLRMYLLDHFGLEFESKETMSKKIDRKELSDLTSAILAERGTYKIRASILAYNDAMHVLRIFSRRAEIGENTMPNPFGFRTWWLTHERAIHRAYINCFGGGRPKYIMRPEFLLNYISLLPSARDVVRSYKTVFPTILGVSLGKRAPNHLIHEVLVAAREASDVNESRAKVMLNQFADRLKTDQLRLYESKYDTH